MGQANIQLSISALFLAFLFSIFPYNHSYSSLVPQLPLFCSPFKIFLHHHRYFPIFDSTHSQINDPECKNIQKQHICNSIITQEAVINDKMEERKKKKIKIKNAGYI